MNPEKFNIKYKAFTVLMLLFLIITPVITKNYKLFSILSLLYNGIITVIFEELIFRGYISKEIESITSNLFAYIFSSILFGVWHLGYVDTVIWRTSMFNPDANIFIIMFWKILTGLIIGLLLGFFRYKNKNVYSSVLIHSFINIIGSWEHML